MTAAPGGFNRSICVGHHPTACGHFRSFELGPQLKRFGGQQTVNEDGMPMNFPPPWRATEGCRSVLAPGFFAFSRAR
jgi:hypothetical protein